MKTFIKMLLCAVFAFGTSACATPAWAEDGEGRSQEPEVLAQPEPAFGWQHDGGVTYYLTQDGAKARGWLCLGGSWYFFADDGVLQTGWLCEHGTWYLLDAETGVMLTGWQDTGGHTYYLADDGALLAGWQRIDGTWYLLNPAHSGTFGALLHGWQWHNNTWYLLDYQTGAMRRGWVFDSGNWYYLMPSGAMADSNRMVDGAWQAFRQDGAWVDARAFCDTVSRASSERKVTVAGALEVPAPQLARVEAEVSDALTSGYDVGFVLVDINSGTVVSYNADRVFYAASSVKAHYLAAMAELHPEAVALYPEDIRETLVFSSDHCYKYLRAIYGNEPMERWCATSGAPMELAQDVWIFHSARDFARLWMRTFLFFSFDETGRGFAPQFSIPSDSAMDMRDAGVYVLSKAGYIYDYVGPFNASCDGGIVYAQNGPYVLAIMSDAPMYLPLIRPLVLALHEAHAAMGM